MTVPFRLGLLRVLACATVALAPLEGYLLEVHGHLAKVAPALLAVTWAVARVRQRRFVTPHPLHGVLAAFAVVLLASTAVHAGGHYAVDYLQRWLPFLVLTVILVDVAAREVPVRALLGAAVAGAVVAAVGALFSLFARGEARASGPLEDPNDLAYFLVAALPLVVAFRPGRKRHAVAMALVALVLAAGAAATFSRGGALALTAAAVWLVVRRVVPVKLVLGGVVALVVVAGGALVVAGPALDRALQEKTFIAGTNVDTRGLRWQAAARMVSAHPALGVGPGGFRDHYAAFSRNAEVDEQTPVAHNMYLEVAAELGVAGFGLFAGLLAVAAVSSERVLRSGGRGARREMAAVQASLIAVVVASTFLSQQYYLPLWSLVAVVAAADLRVRRADACAARDR
ncbi:O-antigen ligase family protein [Saccharothrix variisporea]|uniref:O-antigen ligase-like membrane protein n=1 Tax=Saccharothrix variisporea TaxID=543527 RepID=A0A495XIM2_9PSEU|nr:O-antigen ligase family protein [Saccharothrix variisporea]RKT74220.1 O-antigen ligase-like membrane protein [Saccharothrix variisporea]